MEFLIGCALLAAGFLICFNPGTKMTSDKDDWDNVKKFLHKTNVWGSKGEQEDIEGFLEEFDEKDRAVIERLCLER